MIQIPVDTRHDGSICLSVAQMLTDVEVLTLEFADQPFKWHSGRTSAVTTDSDVAYVDSLILLYTVGARADTMHIV